MKLTINPVKHKIRFVFQEKLHSIYGENTIIKLWVKYGRVRFFSHSKNAVIESIDENV